jgi:hypothetical protein
MVSHRPLVVVSLLQEETSFGPVIIVSRIPFLGVSGEGIVSKHAA